MSEAVEFTLTFDKTGTSKSYVDELVAAEKADRQAADDTEVTARQTADNNLQTQITANADEIANETTTRTNEDARIEAVIDANKETCDNRFTAVNKSIEDEASARTTAVANEASARAEAISNLQSYVDTKTAGALHYKGTVATVSDLPSGATIGDMYNVKSDGQNYAWNGTEWDSLGAIIDVEGINAKIAANTTAINNEIANRQSADNTIVNTNIANEAAARSSADTALQNNITAETNRATAKESDIESQLSSKTTTEIAADFDAVREKLNKVADIVETNGAYIFAFVDSNSHITFAQNANGDIINFKEGE